eukprot:gnl/Hemi2/13813_TR4700_c0_g1_i1.p1 gnl/Hemi2/13813_TR4700_c0_g1~~gnl/Hemi2/13813_TR4700_c0_g1_i1.p1  ORF type:complete len:289 (+),score=67.84 gnl/Hemi2/13813_TR4700_c0_g1_i1:83-868(+)
MSALLAMLADYRFKELMFQLHRNLKPVSEFWGDFSRPGEDALARTFRNLRYFQSNYLLVFAVTLAWTLIMHPSLLIVLLVLACAWVYSIFYLPSSIGMYSTRHKYPVLIGLTVLMLLFTSAGDVLLWTFGLLAAAVLAHALLRSPNLDSKVETFADRVDSTAALSSILIHEMGRANAKALSSPMASPSHLPQHPTSPLNLSHHQQLLQQQPSPLHQQQQLQQQPNQQFNPQQTLSGGHLSSHGVTMESSKAPAVDDGWDEA